MPAKGEPIINKDRCKGCGLCIANCPKSILEFSQDFNVQGVAYASLNDTETCIACSFCATMCPESAIEIRRFPKEQTAKTVEQVGVSAHG